MKIVIISPAYPLRGGIAQHAGILYNRLLSHGHEVKVLTYSRQYPSLFFPGKTQFESSEAEDLKIESEPMIDSIGPLSWLRTAKRARELNPSLVVITYWMPFFAPCLALISVLIRRKTAARILYLCHNIIPHERRPGDIALTKLAFKQADSFIVQSSTVEEQLVGLFPRARYELIPHPVYDTFGKLLDKTEARKRLGIGSEATILFFGLVRGYKGLKQLLYALPIVLESLEVTLLIAGEFYEDEAVYRNLIRELRIEKRIQIRSEFIPNEEVNMYFSAADVAVLPYESATQSGIVQMAYHFNKPCIVTDVGGLGEIVIDGKTGFVVPPGDVKALAEAIVRYYRNDCERVFSKNVEEEKKKYSWEHMVQAVERSADEN